MGWRDLILPTLLAFGTVAAFVALGDVRLTLPSLIAAGVLWLALFFILGRRTDGSLL